MAQALHTLNEGGFGKVYKVRIRGIPVALKKVPYGYMTEADIDREKRVYRSIDHPNVLKLFWDPWLDTENKWNIPLEYISGKDLEKVMFGSQTSIQLTGPVIVQIIHGMSCGLRELHRKNIIHQDLKPDNIMVEIHTNRAVIIDFGLAKIERNGILSGQEGGNRYYAAPEVAIGWRTDLMYGQWAKS